MTDFIHIESITNIISILDKNLNHQDKYVTEYLLSNFSSNVDKRNII